MTALRVANCSGFYGDRLSAAAEMVSGGPIDVLTGDWLAELTMLILAKNRLKDPSAGYAKSFLRQMEQVMGTCLDTGIKVVSNAGGLVPWRLAEELEQLAGRLGLSPVVAFVTGDDLMGRLDELKGPSGGFAHFETKEPLGDREVLTANAYLGGFPIARALVEGADIVVTGRVTDAALVLGPAIWSHGWQPDDLDALAGGVVAGHVIECGTQATGGNYAFFEEVPGREHIGFPIAEILPDGSSVITKHPTHGGLVSVGTVTAQLLYEISSPSYENPDVTARFDTISLTEEGPDRVRISGVRGEPPPESLKVAMNYLGGYRTTVTMMLTGLEPEKKAAMFEAGLWASVEGGKEAFDEVDVSLVLTGKENPRCNEEALSSLRITVKDKEEEKIGRAFTAKVTELALSSYPGLFGDGSRTGAYGVYWPSAVPAELVPAVVCVGGRSIEVPAVRPGPRDRVHLPERATFAKGNDHVMVPLGQVVGARSGDKGSNANVGLWVRSEEAFSWLCSFLTVQKLRELCPEWEELAVDRYELHNLLALNFVIVGLLGEGVAASVRVDAQAKGLGEYLRAKVVPVPVELLQEKGGAR
jgi:hypothetical protein